MHTKAVLAQLSTSGGGSSSHLDNEVCAWLWSRLQDEQEKLKGCQAEREHEIKQVEKYVEDIRALAEERDRLVSQLQEDNRLLKSELIHTKTPTQRMNKWYLEQGNFDRDNLFPLSQLPLPAQFDFLLEEQTNLRESFQKLQTLYQSEKNDSDLCRKKLEETVSQQKRLREEFKQYKLEKETEVEILRTDRSSSESTHSKERKGLRKENKNLQNQLLNLQHSKDKESVELRKTIKDLDEETDRLNLECRSLKNNCEQLRLSLELKEEDLQRTRGQLTSSEEKLKATTESHSSDVSILHQTMENILSSRDTESEQLVCSLRAENESLKERVEQFQTDVERNRGEVEGLEERLREAKALCQEKSQETEKIQKLLQTKIASIKDQLQNQESKDKDEIEHLKKEKQKILKEKDSLDTELSRLKKEFEIKVGETEDQIKALQTQLELKEKTIQTLKTTQKALIEEITGFRQEHEELASQLSSLKLGYSSDVTSQSREMEAKNKALREELQQMKEQIRQRNGEIHKLELELNSVRILLTREKEDNSLVVEKMKKQLTQKDTQVQELMKERQADKERFYEKLQSYKSKREELEEDLDNHSFGSSSHKDNNTSTPKLHRATVGGKNGGGGSGKFSLKDKNELVDMNKENLLEHCLVLQFEMHELLAELDKLTQKQDEDFTRNLQLKSRYKEKCDKLKDQSAKQRQLASEKISSLEHKVTSLNLELSHQTSLRSSVEQMLKRVNEDKRDLSSKLESAVEENKSLSRSLTSSERNLRDWQHENETLKEKLSATVDEKINLERNLKEYEMKLYNGNVSPMNTLRSSGYGNSLSIFASH
ncbi:myosin-11-like [Symsagittifera roscoffensis]|uniref:myosin-11-like n=1 Tax=Symsagittifera roscoffensis TaxID=84072 RepID=UPI00307C5FF3